MNLVPGTLVEREGVWRFLAEGAEVPLIVGVERLPGGGGREARVWCGLRAEDLAVSALGPWSGTVVAREYLGWGSRLRLDGPGSGLWLQVSGAKAPEVGGRVRVQPSGDRAVYFEVATGRRLGVGLGGVVCAWGRLG
jgi:hypothetical protein